MKIIFSLFLSYLSVVCFAQNNDVTAIKKILTDQTIQWNNGNLDQFMKGYWENDSLQFIGKSGPVYGYNNALNNYKKGYPDTSAMGKLSFDVISVKKLSTDYYFVTGKWFLKRSAGDLKGVYTLLFRKINGEWKIIADHSS